MAVFPITHFRYATRYPETTTRIRFGRGYEFAAMPSGKDQRIFILTIPGLKYFTDGAGAIDLLQHPERNMAVLEDFYNTHKMAASFDLEHPTYGTVRCRFNRPLEIPEGVAGGDGSMREFSLEMIELP